MRASSLLIASALTLAGAQSGCSDADTVGEFEDEERIATSAAEFDGADSAAHALPQDFENSLSDAWTCGDLLLHVANPERSIMLTLYWPSLLDEGIADPSGDWDADVGGADGHEVAIVVHTGTRLDAGTCARRGEEPAVIDQTWTAVAQSGHLELAASDSAPPRLSTWLWDMELRREGDGATVLVEQLERVGVERAG